MADEKEKKTPKKNLLGKSHIPLVPGRPGLPGSPNVIKHKSVRMTKAWQAVVSVLPPPSLLSGSSQRSASQPGHPGCLIQAAGLRSCLEYLE